MKTITTAALVVLTVGLAGCIRPNAVDANGNPTYVNNCLIKTMCLDIPANRPITPAPQISLEAQRANDDSECRSYGLTFGTPEYAHCRETMLTLHVSQGQADAADRQARTAAALSLLKASQPPPVQPPVQPWPFYHPTINCLSSGVGPTVSTTCN
jgi:hypothetical protein